MTDLVAPSSPRTEQRVTGLALRKAPAGPTAPSPPPAESIYRGLVQQMAMVGQGVRNQHSVDLRPLVRTVRYLVKNAQVCADMLPEVFAPYSGDDFLARHAVNSIVLATHTAPATHFDDPCRLRLGVAAALHDLGMYVLPEEILHKVGKYTQAEEELVRSHPRKGYGLLRELGQDVSPIAEVVRQEHEREDGKGYPHGIAGPLIAPEAKVMALTDMFEAMVHERPWRPRLCPVQVVRALVSESGKSLSPHVVRAFVYQITPFPITSQVELSDGRVGQIVRTRAHAPLRPVVRLPRGLCGEPVEVDLEANPLLQIKSVVPPNEATPCGK